MEGLTRNISGLWDGLKIDEKGNILNLAKSGKKGDI